jgi:hypothetical protein
MSSEIKDAVLVPGAPMIPASLMPFMNSTSLMYRILFIPTIPAFADAKTRLNQPDIEGGKCTSDISTRQVIY